MKWDKTRIGRPVDRPRQNDAEPADKVCPHCGMGGAVLDFQLVRCANVECRYFDPAVAMAVDTATIERRMLETLRKMWGT